MASSNLGPSPGTFHISSPAIASFDPVNSPINDVTLHGLNAITTSPSEGQWQYDNGLGSLSNENHTGVGGTHSHQFM